MLCNFAGAGKFGGSALRAGINRNRAYAKPQSKTQNQNTPELRRGKRRHDKRSRHHNVAQKFHHAIIKPYHKPSKPQKIKPLFFEMSILDASTNTTTSTAKSRREIIREQIVQENRFWSQISAPKKCMASFTVSVKNTNGQFISVFLMVSHGLNY